MNLYRLIVTSMILLFLFTGSSAISHLNSKGRIMDEENKNEGLPSQDYKDYGLDALAIETANEMADEALTRFADIMESSLTEEEKEQEIEKLLGELNISGNEIYRRKKQKGAN